MGFVDDAAIFPPGDAPLPGALAAHTKRRQEAWSDLVGAFVVRDTDLPALRGTEAPLAVVSTGGAGQLDGPLRLADRLGLRVSALEIALRDLDDPAGNARRVIAALDHAHSETTVPAELQVFVELPQGGTSHGWLSAADEIAARDDLGLRLKFRTGGVHADLFPSPEQLASWIEAALDRETAFKCTAGLHHAVRHTDEATGFTHHGFLNVLAATRASLDGGDTLAVLGEQDPVALVAALPDLGTLARTRRWFGSFGCCEVREPLDDLVNLGLVPSEESR